MAETEMMAAFPDAAAIIVIIKGRMTTYGTEHGKHHTETANGIYQTILDGVELLMVNIEDNCGNDVGLVAQTGFKAVKTTKTDNPVTGKVIHAVGTPTGEGKFMAEYLSDEYAKEFFGETKPHGAPDSAYKQSGFSENHTMYFDGYALGYTHGQDVDGRIWGNGTAGPGEKSAMFTILLD